MSLDSYFMNSPANDIQKIKSSTGIISDKDNEDIFNLE